MALGDESNSANKSNETDWFLVNSAKRPCMVRNHLDIYEIFKKNHITKQDMLNTHLVK